MVAAAPRRHHGRPAVPPAAAEAPNVATYSACQQAINLPPPTQAEAHRDRPNMSRRNGHATVGRFPPAKSPRVATDAGPVASAIHQRRTSTMTPAEAQLRRCAVIFNRMAVLAATRGVNNLPVPHGPMADEAAACLRAAEELAAATSMLAVHHVAPATT